MAQLSRIHYDDIVEVDVKGRRAIAFARDRAGRKLKIHPITPNFGWREVAAHQVIRHWRLTKNTPKQRTAGVSTGQSAE